MPNFLAQEICGLVAGEMNRVWEDLMGFFAMLMMGGCHPLRRSRDWELN
jgi:hypothetical protein